MRSYVSGSALPLAGKCASSAVLPQVKKIGEKDRIGSALHQHGRDRAVLGMSEAMARLDLVAAEWELNEQERDIFRGRAFSFEWNPPRGALAEVAMAYCEDGTTVITSGGRGQYDELPANALFPIQIDLCWAEPTPLYREGDRIICPPESVLWVVDLKTGRDAHVDPVEMNLQTLGGLVAAARLTGAKSAIPGIVYWEKGPGTWDVPEQPLDAAGIDAAEQILRRVVGRVAAQRARYATGEPMEFTTGQHCTWCDAETHCPAKVAAIKRLLEEPAPLEARPLSRQAARRGAEMLASVERFTGQLRDALKAYSDVYGAIDVGHGKAWGPYLDPQTEIDPVVARQALEGEIGADAAAQAFGVKTSRAKIEAAVKTAHDAQGLKKQRAAAMRRIMGQVKDRGGLIEGARTCYGIHQSLPMAPQEPAQLPPLQPAVPLEIEGDE